MISYVGQKEIVNCILQGKECLYSAYFIIFKGDLNNLVIYL